VCLAAAVAAWLTTGCGSARHGTAGGTTRPAQNRPAQTHATQTRTAQNRPAQNRAAQTRPAPRSSSTDGNRLATGLNQAEDVIDSPASSAAQVARAALFQQLAIGLLEREPAPARRATLALVDPQARAGMRTDLAAESALSGLGERRIRLPPWRIIAPPAPATLLGFFRAAQARYGVPWQYLAAIELVETRFGRIRGPSSAGAQGPMQFLPVTWAAYGRGSIDDPRAAILAAARYLVANGAPGDMAGALYHYNNSRSYVAAVSAYARRMQRQPRAYDGYYNWQVIYAYAGRTVVLPVGFPRVRPVPLRRLLANGMPPPVR
jgi:membrane-bound lytic murein transglycosylase B